jgi:hypothetical protein
MNIWLNLRFDSWPEAPPTFADFRACLLETKRPWRSILVSAALHCVFIPLLPAMLEHLPTVGWVEPELRIASARPLLIRLPEKVHLTYSPPRPEPLAANRPAPADAPTRERQKAPSGYRTVAKRRFEIAAAPVNAQHEQTLLQPRLPDKTPPRLPHLSFWSVLFTPPPSPKLFIEPGRQTGAGQPALADPRLDIPNREPRIGDLQILKSDPVAANPTLPVDPSSSSPLRTLEQSKKDSTQPLSMDHQEGDPVNVLALNPEPAAPVDEVAVPAVTHVGHLPRTVNEDAEYAGTETKGRTPGSRERHEAASSSPGMRGKPEETTVTTAGASANYLHNSPETVASEPIRIVHPQDGLFDVVLVQASPEHAMLLEGPTPLTGRPIYTVYLQVGTTKEWILQYCLQQSPEYEVKTGGAVVQLGNPTQVKAPYPKVSIVPPQPSMPNHSRLVLHGFITDHGVFRELDTVRHDDKQAAAHILPYLQQWRFRPATRDGQAVEVEILLIVPGPPV